MKGDTDKWEGEDEDEPLKDNWDDDEEEEKKAKKSNFLLLIFAKLVINNSLYNHRAESLNYLI